MKVIAVINEHKVKIDDVCKEKVDFFINQPVNSIKIIDSIANLTAGSHPKLKTVASKSSIDDFVFNAKALVAEDNLDSQDLFKIMLREYGISVDVANNGLEAVNKIEDNNYDLIFLDNNMPVYDGTEVAKISIDNEIKTGEKHTPLIAITASAIKGDRERFLSSGFDDYLPKPVNIYTIKNILETYLSHLKKEKPRSLTRKLKGSKRKNKNNNQRMYDIEHAAIELGITVETLKNLISKALIRTNNDLVLLKQAIDQNKFKNIHQLSHKMKGTFYSYLFNKLGDIAFEIEINSSEKKMIDYAKLCDKIESELNILKNYLFNSTDTT